MTRQGPFLALVKILLFACCLLTGNATRGAQNAKALLQEAEKRLAEAQKLHQQDRIEQALPAAEAALALQVSLLGQDHPNLVPILRLIGHLHLHQDRLEQADLDFRRALTVAENNYGTAHPHAAEVLYDLGDLNEVMGRYDRAEQLLQRALIIEKNAIGASEPIIASILTKLGQVYRQQDRFNLAQDTVEQAVQISQDAHGEKGKEFIYALNELALIYEEWGDREKAQDLLSQAISISEKREGPKAHLVGLSLSHLASVFLRQGDPERAAPLLRRAVENFSDIMDPEVPHFLRSLASVEIKRAHYDAADALLTRALAIKDAAGGKQGSDVIGFLHQLGEVSLKRNRIELAEVYVQRALRTAENHYGQASPETALSLIWLGDVYRAKADALHALASYEQAGTRLALSGRGHHSTMATVLARIGELYIQKDNPAAAVATLTQLLGQTEQGIIREGLTLSDNRLAVLMNSLRSQEDLVYSIFSRYPQREDALRASLATALLRKGRVFDETAEASRILHNSPCESDRTELSALRGLRMRIARLELEGHTELGLQVYTHRLQGLLDQAVKMEDTIMRRTAEIRDQRRLPEPSNIIDQVMGTLKRREVLIEYVQYHLHDFTQLNGSTTQTDTRYMALLLYPGGRASGVDLGPAGVIDAAVAKLMPALSSPLGMYQEPAQEVYRLLVKPLAGRLTRHERLIISPDGSLSLIPFGALLNENKVFLRDTYTITYLTSGRDLLRREYATKKIRPDSVVVFADPSFTEAPTLPTAGVPPAMTSRRERSMELTDLQPLPGTRAEAREIIKVIPQARLFVGREASEPALLSLQAPGILHIATHGIYMEDNPLTTSDRFAQDSQPMPHNPMLRSALALAGARTGRVTTDDSDGVVTALEASSMNLWGTQLVVLSACGTGRGDIRLGQGVYGLRRALLVAGAETVVTSLWNVNDAMTKELMLQYYRALRSGRGRAAALQDGARMLARRYAHPYYWASFIAIGRSEALVIEPAIARRPAGNGGGAKQP